MLILRKDKSVKPSLGELVDDFVFWGNRAYDVYPDFVRIALYPMGWPALFQEPIPSSLYLEEDAVPLDWVTLDTRYVRSMELRAALDENFLRKLVHESVQEGQKLPFNVRKWLPMAILGIGAAGLIVMIVLRGGCV